jgi:hypothetical protein
LGQVLKNIPNNQHKPVYWKMKNGYALAAGETSIRELSHKLHTNPDLVQVAMAKLRVGVHWDTEGDVFSKHRVAQVYCSALPVAYDSTASTDD